MKKGMLALLITPMVLLSLVGCGGQKEIQQVVAQAQVQLVAVLAHQ